VKQACLLVLALGVTGCGSIGPGTVTRDRFDYTGAVAESWKSQILITAVPYRGHWFYVDDRDMASKRLFTFLMFIFTLVEAPGREGAPVLTIPTQ
jgi:hypothetical protein